MLASLFSRIRGSHPTVSAEGVDLGTTAAVPDAPMAQQVWYGSVTAGVACHNAAELDAAIEKWRNTLAMTPNFVRAHLRLGLALCEKGEYAEALVSLQKATRLGSSGGLSSTDNAMAHCAVGCSLLGLGGPPRADSALESFRRTMHLLNTMPDFAPAGLTKGLSLFEQGLYDLAAEQLREATQLNAEDGLIGTDVALAHCALGCTLLNQSAVNRDAAIDEFHTTFRLLSQCVF